MKIEIENVLPQDIEARSFAIITKELEQEGICLPAEQAPVIKRCIHTSADFDYARNLSFSEGVIENAAKEKGTTRAVASMEKACALEERLIFAIGNAPTALIRLYELIQEGKIRPELVIAVPVGFVNVVQSKELILSLEDTPYIVARGRKGGSNIAACICNALIYMLDRS